MATKRRYWLLKTEPGVCSIDDILASNDATTGWDGVRNYQARNYLRDEMQVGDQALIYHSNTTQPHVAGIATIVRCGYPDPTQFEPTNTHFDPTASRQNPRWFQVDVKAIHKFNRPVTLSELKQYANLSNMVLFKNGRLSVQPVTKLEFDYIVKLGS